jgi:hypothetical protein
MRNTLMEVNTSRGARGRADFPCGGGGGAKAGWIAGFLETTAGRVPRLSVALAPEDRRGYVRCRFSDRFRMGYSVVPGLYAAGNPGTRSPVLVTANYKMSLDRLRSGLGGLDAWVLVLDTKGINVWCAAGKGTFGTTELVRRVRETGLKSLVKHRTLTLPQLGAAGVHAHRVKRECGFGVRYGPVRARDLGEYLRAGGRATADMRTVRFGIVERAELAPMELVSTLKQSYPWLIGLFVFFGLKPQGIIFREAFFVGLPVVALASLMVLAGCVLAPLLLPVLPSRSFALKGWLLGAAVTGAFAATRFGSPVLGRFLLPMTALLFPAVCSYLTLNFTGCTPFTGVSGVKRELRIAIPFYVASAALAGVFAVLHLLRNLEVL